MNEPGLTVAFAGWAAIFAVVVGYDVWALRTERHTLSAAFWHTKKHPVGRSMLAVMWGGLTWHLMFGDRQVAPDRIHVVYEMVHPFYIGRNWLIRKRLAFDT
jgi:hypothetical protein